MRIYIKVPNDTENLKAFQCLTEGVCSVNLVGVEGREVVIAINDPSLGTLSRVGEYCLVWAQDNACPITMEVYP